MPGIKLVPFRFDGAHHCALADKAGECRIERVIS